MEAVPALIPLLDVESNYLRLDALDSLKSIRKRYEEVHVWKEWYAGVKSRAK